MKKLLLIFISVISIFCCSFVHRAIIEVGIITNDTKIENDLKQLDLLISDYVVFENIEENKYLDQVYLIAIGENRIDKESTDLYLYFYNPVKVDVYSNYYFNLRINSNDYNLCYLERGSWSDYEGLFEEPDVYLDFVSKDEGHNIIKTKFNYKNIFSNRKYSVNEIIRLSDEQYFTNPFEARFTETNEAGKLESNFSYNSFIYITEDILVPVLLKPDFKWGEIFDWIFASTKKNYAYFYNFSSSRDIDEIIEMDCVFDYILDIQIDPGCPSPDYFDDVIGKTELGKFRTLYNEPQYYDWLSSSMKFETFQTPASDRFSEEDFGKLEFTEEEKKMFTDYEHSVLVALSPVYLHSFMGPVGMSCEHYKKVDNLKVTRIKFEADGKIYNSYVGDDVDNPVDPIEPNNPDNLFDKLKGMIDTVLNFLNSLTSGIGLFIKVFFWLFITILSLVLIGYIVKFVQFIMSIFRRNN